MRRSLNVVPVALFIALLALAHTVSSRCQLKPASSKKPPPLANNGILGDSLANGTNETGSTSTTSADPGPNVEGSSFSADHDNVKGVNSDLNTTDTGGNETYYSQGYIHESVTDEGQHQQVDMDGGCTCVPFYLCDKNNTIIDDGREIIDMRMQDGCSEDEVFCCPLSTIGATEGPAVTTATPSTRMSGKPGGGCGLRNIKDSVMGGDQAQYGEFPWMVAVTGVGESIADAYVCGGSLIHPRVVLTAAHHVRGKNNLTVRAGERDMRTSDARYPTQVRRVSQVIVHEQFYGGSLFNDPALLILEEPVDTSMEHVGLICLPEQAEAMDGRQCVASGWGKDRDGKMGMNQGILKRVELPIVSREPCVEALRKTRLGKHFKLHESFICAGGIRGKDTCKGDGGSPLVCPSRNSSEVSVQAGIVAWGIGCGSADTPAVYVNVPHFVNWINDKLTQQGIQALAQAT